MAQQQPQQLHACVPGSADHSDPDHFTPASVSVAGRVLSHDQSRSVMTGRAFYQSAKGQSHAVDTGFSRHFCCLLVRGDFYLPRILVYYAQSNDRETKAVLAVMARKLYRFVTPVYAARDCAGPVAPLSFQWELLPVVGLDDR